MTPQERTRRLRTERDRSHGAEQQVAGEVRARGRAVADELLGDRVVPHLPEQQAVGPGDVAGRGDRPAGDEVADRLDMTIDGPLGGVLEGLPDRLLDRVE